MLSTTQQLGIDSSTTQQLRISPQAGMSHDSNLLGTDGINAETGMTSKTCLQPIGTSNPRLKRSTHPPSHTQETLKLTEQVLAARADRAVSGAVEVVA